MVHPDTNDPRDDAPPRPVAMPNQRAHPLRDPDPAPRIGITGHSDLTPPSMPVVRATLHARLCGSGAEWVGVSCLACGADQVFAGLVLELGGRLEVILPAADYRVRKVEAGNAAEFDRLLGRADHVTVLEFDSSCREAYMAASVALLDRVDELIAVWDGHPALRHGSTGDVVAEARRRGMPLTVLWPAGAARCTVPARVERVPAPR